MGQVLQANYPLEYVAFIHVQMNTKEGFVYMFAAIDAYSGYAINLGVERDAEPATILKNIYLLTEHEEFKERNTHGFTLVLGDYETLSERIEAIIQSVGGQVMYNKTFNNLISNPLLLSMARIMKGT